MLISPLSGTERKYNKVMKVLEELIMKKFLKFVLVGFMFMLSGCSGSSSYSDLTIMDGVEIGVEEWLLDYHYLLLEN